MTVTRSVLAGNAMATLLNTVGGITNLNLQDPDSLIFAPNGQLVLDSQSDQQLVFITNPGAVGPSVIVLNLATSVDDTVFAAGGLQRPLVADRDSNIIYSLTVLHRRPGNRRRRQRRCRRYRKPGRWQFFAVGYRA